MTRQKLKFAGTLDELKDILRDHDIRGDMSERPGFHRFETNNGACLHWYTKGTICFQGPEMARRELEEKLEGVFDGSGTKANDLPYPVEQLELIRKTQALVFSILLMNGSEEPFVTFLKLAKEGNRKIVIHCEGNVALVCALLPGTVESEDLTSMLIGGSFMKDGPLIRDVIRDGTVKVTE